VLAEQALREERSRLVDRVAGAELRLLRDEVAGRHVVLERGGHEFRHVTHHQHHFLRPGLAARLHGPLHHGLACGRMHDLRQVALHARALAGGKHDRREWRLLGGVAHGALGAPRASD
jgi:hypothetical protein